jgi:hypothetical protein
MGELFSDNETYLHWPTSNLRTADSIYFSEQRPDKHSWRSARLRVYPPPPGQYGGFGFNGNISSSRSWTTTTVDQNSYTKQFTDTAIITVNNLEKSRAVMATTTIDRYTISIPFSATLVVDADISPNDMGYTKLSKIFPDAAKRSFSIKGTVTEVDWADAKSVTDDIQFQSQWCAGQRKDVITIPLK